MYFMDDSFWLNSSYSYNLFEGSNWIGVILIINYHNACAQGDIDTFCVLAEHIRQWYGRADRYRICRCLGTDAFALFFGVPYIVISYGKAVNRVFVG